MSGIVGMVNLDGAPVDRDLIWHCTDFMSYRGPDAQKVWIDRNIGLGHTLLRTTLESETERQPLTLNGKVWLVADARIDARDELIRKLPSLSNSNPNDAELILHAYETWGEECVEHLIGDFVFAIWESVRQRLFCARDHVGVKPFFYAFTSNSFIFSNTLNSIRLDRRVSDELNEVAIGDYLLFGLNQDLSTTTFRDINRLPAGHTLTVSNGTIKTRCYWRPTESELCFRDQQLYVQHFDELLIGAVKDRMRTNRVAVSMSGGLDSTSLAAIAHEQLGGPHGIHAYSVVYDNLIPDEERHYSQAAAKHIGIPVTHISADQYPLFDKQILSDMDQPEPFLLSALTGQFNAVLRLCASHGRVAFTGYDGDALMNKPPSNYFTSAARAFRLRELTAGLAWYMKSRRSLRGLGIRTWFKQLFGEPGTASIYPEWIDESFSKRTNLRERSMESSPTQIESSDTKPAALTALASKVWAPLFEGYDPGATKLALEFRHPFTDLRLIQFLLSIPAVPWCVEKHILRVAMQHRLPPSVLNRDKTSLTADPALQITRRASVRWLDSFEVSPQLRCFVNLNKRPSIADEQTSESLWASLRVYALNYWLSNSRPADRVELQKTNSSKRPIAQTSIA
jgi:asparagine synthase (glutamine-hydrolysing)